MPTTLPSPKGGSFSPAPEGSHAAACCRIVDLGTQDTSYKGVAGRKRQLIISWELFTEERMADGRPFSIGRKYTWSTHEKSGLRKDLEMWRGKKFAESDFGPGGFDIRKILGQPCLISVAHGEYNGNVTSNVAGVTKLPRGMTVGGPSNPEVFLWLDPDDFDRKVFDSLSDKLKEIIGLSPEYKAIITGKPVAHEELHQGVDPNDDIPF